MTRLKRWFDFAGRRLRWWFPVVGLALMPKCLVCVAAYLGLGAALGLGSAQICGAAPGTAMGWASWLTMAGGALGMCLVIARLWRRRRLG